MNYLVLTMMFHTYLVFLVAKAKQRPVTTVTDVKTLFIRNAREEPNQDVKIDKDWIEMAKKRNFAAKIVFIFVTGLFNLIFWTVAMLEYQKKPEEYLNDSNF